MDELDLGALAAGQEADELPVGEDEPLEVERHPASAGALGGQELDQLRQALQRRPPGQGVGDFGGGVGSGFDSQHRSTPPGDSSRTVPDKTGRRIKDLGKFTRDLRYGMS